MRERSLDHATKIMYLTEIIRSLYVEHGLPKDVIIEDFIDVMNRPILKEESDERD